MKTSIDELAVLGGEPAFAEPLHTGRPYVGDRQRLMNRLNAVLDRRWLTNDGPLVQEFSLALERLTGTKHVIPVANGTLALEVAARSLGLEGEVIVPSFTFVATAHALQWLGIKPVFCDIDPLTHNIDPGAIEALITPATTAIVGVHLWGRPCDVKGIEEIARRHRLKVIFDAAHALNVSIDGRKVGNFGDAEVFSFHATKFVNTLEGGAIATNDSELADRIRLMINFGFSGYDSVDALGINGKMDEFSAAMGLTGLDALCEIVATNTENYRTYSRCLEGVEGMRLLEFDPATTPNYQYVVAEVDSTQFGWSRDQILAVLQRENVLARRYFFPGCHQMEPYRSMDPDVGQRLPATVAICERVLCLPCGSEISSDQIEAVCGLIRLLADMPARFRRRVERALSEPDVTGRLP